MAAKAVKPILDGYQSLAPGLVGRASLPAAIARNLERRRGPLVSNRRRQIINSWGIR